MEPIAEPPMNREVIGLYKSSNKKAAIAQFCTLYGDGHNKRSLESKIDAVISRYQKLIKAQKQKNFQHTLDEFLDTPVAFPKAIPLRVVKPHKAEEYCQHEVVCKRLAEENAILLRNNKTLLSYKRKQKSFNLLKHNLKKSTVHNQSLKCKLKKKQKSIDALNRSHAVLFTRLRLKRQELKNIKCRNTYNCAQKEKHYISAQILEETNKTISGDLILLQKELNDMQQKLAALQQDNEYLQLLLIDNVEKNKTVQTFDDNANAFNTKLQLLVFKLLDFRVAPKNVPNVISAVLELDGKVASRLPSTSTVNNMNISRLSLCRSQVAELHTAQNTCLYTDETSKFGDKYGGYHLSTEGGEMYVLGVRDMPTKSASDTLGVFQEILHDLDSSVDKTTNTISHGLIQHIASTMSDQASTEKKFNKLLQSYRESVLPLTIEHYVDLPDEAKSALSRMYHFFCGLHPLVHFAECATSTLGELEKAFFDGDVPTSDRSFNSRDKSAAERLIRTTCKGFARGGDEKCGVFLQFSVSIAEFLKDNSLKAVPLHPFHGNRFNILFAEAAGVYFLKDQIMAFLEYHDKNRLLQSVNHDIKQDYFLAGVKALGLICYLITSPLWSLVERRDISITEMGKFYCQLTSFLAEMTENASELEKFITGDSLPFKENNTYVKRDCIFKSLITPNAEIDHTVLSMLVPIFTSMLRVAKNMYSPHLPGGEYFDVADVNVQLQTKAVIKHNVFAESIFGYLDHILRAKPNINSISIESYIMFSYNKTASWLDKKSIEERESLVKRARLDISAVRAEFKQRCAKIKQHQIEAVKQKMLKNQEAAARKLKHLENLTSDVVYYGLWQSPQDIDSNISALPTKKEQEVALKAQLKFREEVLHQVADKAMFRLSCKDAQTGKRKNYTVQELITNLHVLVSKSLTEVTENTDKVPLLVGKKVSHRFKDQENNHTWYRGKVVSQVIIVINNI